MAEQLTLTVQKRAPGPKGVSRRLRVEGTVPGIFYNHAGENIPVQVKEIPLVKLYRKAGYSHIFHLEIDDNGQTTVRPTLIWDLAYHPYKRRLMHVDFYGIDPNRELYIEVPVVVTGEPKGVKEEGGVLDLYRDFIEVCCLPKDIPDKIVIDVAGLALNQMIHISDIAMPAGVKVSYDDDFAVVGVHLPEVQKEEVEEAPAELLAEGEEAAAAEEGGEEEEKE